MKMRFTTIAILVLAMVALSSATPAKSKKTPCGSDCIGDYSESARVCAIENGKPLLFSSRCVFDKFNCEHPDRKYAPADMSKCPAGTSERLN